MDGPSVLGEEKETMTRTIRTIFLLLTLTKFHLAIASMFTSVANDVNAVMGCKLTVTRLSHQMKDVKYSVI
jgi:hypothetical protein